MEQQLAQEQRQQQFSSSYFSVAPGVWGTKDIFVNCYIIQDLDSGVWALVDAGLKWSAPRIKAMAKDIFGAESKPSSIILTHGHFDHVGALASLLKEWDVPVYAHEQEIPYLTGQSSYPPPDPSVGGGLMSTMSFLFPAGPIDIRQYVKSLPFDNTIPELPGWKFIHTPGHAPGHISLFREHDKVLIAGDAFVTTKAESAICTLLQIEEISGPPKYFTCNWASAKLSVLKLRALDPEVVVSGHGSPMRGEEMIKQLDMLSKHFDEVATPAQGRYVQQPAVTNENGTLFLPPKTESIPMALKVMAAAVVGISIGFMIYTQIRKQLA
jgi:glyoxylase-like metal-dependent hydrolase (beta-lactamase superfamily II)